MNEAILIPFCSNKAVLISFLGKLRKLKAHKAHENYMSAQIKKALQKMSIAAYQLRLQKYFCSLNVISAQITKTLEWNQYISLYYKDITKELVYQGQWYVQPKLHMNMDQYFVLCVSTDTKPTCPKQSMTIFLLFLVCRNSI